LTKWLQGSKACTVNTGKTCEKSIPFPFISNVFSNLFFPLKGHTTIREAKQSDKEFLTRLSGEVFSIYGPYGRTVTRWFESGITLTLLSMVGEKPVGFVMIGALPGDRDGETRAEVLAIAVTPGFQRRGIGKALLQRAEKRVEEWGEQRLFLHTAKENHLAQKLFLKNGYRPIALKKSFYPSGQDALMMVNEFGNNPLTNLLNE